MKVSIIILAYNNIDLTVKCLQSIKKNTPEKYLTDVVVIDNASADETKEVLSKNKWIKLTINKENIGFSRGCNQGARLSKGEVLLFLNNDTEVHKGWLETMLADLEDDRVAVVGSKLLFPNGTVQHAGIGISNDHIPRHIYYGDNPEAPWVNKKRKLNAVTAACIAIKRTIFEKVGGFDETYINGMEDIDLCLKVRNLGFDIIYEPKSVVTHHESATIGRFKYNKHNNDTYLSRWSNFRPDENRIYREDNMGFWYIFKVNYRNFLYGYNNNYFIRTLRLVLVIFDKFKTLLVLLFRLDFKTISEKIQGKLYGKN